MVFAQAAPGVGGGAVSGVLDPSAVRPAVGSEGSVVGEQARWRRSRSTAPWKLLDVLMTTELLSRAERQAKKEKLRRHPKVSRHAGKLAAAVAVLLEAAEWGEQVRLEQVWDAIESKVSRTELRAAVARIAGFLLPTDADPDTGGAAALSRHW